MNTFMGDIISASTPLLLSVPLSYGNPQTLDCSLE